MPCLDNHPASVSPRRHQASRWRSVFVIFPWPMNALTRGEVELADHEAAERVAQVVEAQRPRARCLLDAAVAAAERRAVEVVANGAAEHEVVAAGEPLPRGELGEDARRLVDDRDGAELARLRRCQHACGPARLDYESRVGDAAEPRVAANAMIGVHRALIDHTRRLILAGVHDDCLGGDVLLLGEQAGEGRGVAREDLLFAREEGGALGDHPGRLGDLLAQGGVVLGEDAARSRIAASSSCSNASSRQ